MAVETKEAGRTSPWLTVAEAAAYLRVNRTTLWRACRDGRLKKSGSGGVTRYHVEDLDRFLSGGAQDRPAQQ